MDHILSWMTFFPLLGGLAIAFVPKAQENLIKWLAVVATLVPLALSLVLVQHFDSGTAAVQFIEKGQWISSLNVDYHLGVDGKSILLVILTALISCLAVVASWNIKKMVKGYFLMLMLLHVGMMGVFCSLDGSEGQLSPPSLPDAPAVTSCRR